jgi:hypothetical protein
MLQRTIDYAVLVGCSVMYGAAVIMLKHMQHVEGRPQQAPIATHNRAYSPVISGTDSRTV